MRVGAISLAWLLIGSLLLATPTQVMTLSESLLLLERMVSKLQEDLQNSRADTTRLLGDLRKANALAESLRLELEKVSEELKNSNESLSDLRGQVGMLESSLEQSEQALKRVESEIRRWKFRARLRGVLLVIATALAVWKTID